MDRSQWLERRRRGIGSSDAPAIALRKGEHAGVFRTPLAVYLDKVGAMPERESEAMLIGRLLEDDCAEAFSARTGLEVEPGGGLLSHPEHPWMLCTPDFRVLGNRPLECKAVRSFEDWGEDGGDVVPHGYAVQVQHQVAVMGADAGHLAALCGTSLRCYEIPRNDELIAGLIAVERDFWHAVVNRLPPEPDWSHPDTPKLVQLLHRPDPKAPEADMPAWSASLLDRYEELGEQIRQLEKDREAAKARLAEAMGEAPAGRFMDGRRLVRRVVSRGEYTVKATSYVQYSIKGAK